MYVLEPPPHYYFSGNANAFAAAPTVNPASGCQNCDHLEWWQRPACELGKLGCEYQAKDKQVTSQVQKTVRDSVLGQSNAVQNTAKDWTKSFSDASNSTVKFFADTVGQYWPFIAMGGALLLVVLLIKR